MVRQTALLPFKKNQVRLSEEAAFNEARAMVRFTVWGKTFLLAIGGRWIVFTARPPRALFYG